ncbi:hypothetical protein HPP92_010325 [Vanilla planifolia]|uniref:Uncharacterized protein n=1 Tax=Vanilla planifolia TaxID=51239 RepID=A0A835QYP4_VANPL|nr:hypothetical protein HPP92_010325 [Vanilla planifolia]
MIEKILRDKVFSPRLCRPRCAHSNFFVPPRGHERKESKIRRGLAYARSPPEVCLKDTIGSSYGN